MSAGSVEVTLRLSLTPAQLALAFAELDAGEQAAFFVEVAKIACGWPPGSPSMQWWRIGLQLTRDASAQNIIRHIHEGMTEQYATGSVVVAERDARGTDLFPMSNPPQRTKP